MTTPLLPMGCPPHGNVFIALSGRLSLWSMAHA